MNASTILASRVAVTDFHSLINLDDFETLGDAELDALQYVEDVDFAVWATAYLDN